MNYHSTDDCLLNVFQNKVEAMRAVYDQFSCNVNYLLISVLYLHTCFSFIFLLFFFFAYSLPSWQINVSINV
jgi:hypothetical protein